jgi:hypothetical protein
VIDGTVTYGNAKLPGPATRFVPNVLITASGSPNLTDTTGAPGTYSLTGFGAGSYTITPTKTGGQNGALTSFDASLIAQYSVGNLSLDANQKIVADVSGTGGISSFDASMVARYAASVPGTGSSGNWLFNPTSNFHATVTSSIAGEDYSALLMGDVSGNWGDPATFRPALRGGPENPASVIAPTMVTPADNEIVIPVNVQGATDKGIVSYEFDLRYDPQVIQPQVNPVDVAGTVSEALSVVANAESRGLLRVVVYGVTPLDSNGVLLNLRFTAVGAPGTVSPLTWERMVFNEGTPQTLAADGQIELIKPGSDQAEISGRLLSATGQGIPNARVTLTDTTGQARSRTVMSNGFGVFRFGDLRVGQTYTISGSSKQYDLAPLTVSVTGNLVNVDLIAQP